MLGMWRPLSIERRCRPIKPLAKGSQRADVGSDALGMLGQTGGPVSYQRSYHGVSRGSTVSLFDDIDNELGGWKDDDHPADKSSLDVASPSVCQEPDYPDQEPRNVGDSTIEAEADVPVAVLEDGAEEAWGSDDDLFTSLMATQSDESDGVDLESDQETETLFPAWDWGELDEFDSEDDAEADDASTHIVVNPAAERIALHDKVQRAAAKIIRDANWERDEGLPILTDILMHHHCHAKTIGALRELAIEHQVDPEMLSILHEVRSAWRAHGYNRVHSVLGARDGWANIPWGLALHITEKLGVQSESEVMEFFEICFNDWCEVGFFDFPIFAYYLMFVINTFDSPLASTIHTVPDIARAMLTARGEQLDLPGNPVDLDLEYYGIA